MPHDLCHADISGTERTYSECFADVDFEWRDICLRNGHTDGDSLVEFVEVTRGKQMATDALYGT